MKSQQRLRWLSAVAGLGLAIGAGHAAAQKTQLNVYTALETDQIKAYEAAFNKVYPDVELKFTRDSTGVITAKVLEISSLARVARESGATLIVIGSRRPGIGGWMNHLIGGSTAGHLAHTQPLPVTIVPLSPEQTTPQEPAP